MILSSSTKTCMFLVVPLFSQSAHAFLLRSRGTIFCRNVVDKSAAIFSSSSRRYHNMVSSRTSSTSIPTMSTSTSKSNVILHRDKLETDKKRNAITAAGLDSLHVVLDFDHTLTSYLRHQPHVHNNDNSGSKGADISTQCRNDEMNNSPPNREDICPECHDVIQYGNYEPLERRHSFCSAIDIIYADQQEEQLTELSEWWIRFHEAVIAHQITEQEVRTAAQEAHIVLRPGAVELLDMLATHNVQTTIVSAGVSTIIEEVFQQNDVQLPKNTQVIANVPVFSSSGGKKQGDDNERQIVAFEEPLIYSRNKAEVLIGMGFLDDPQKEENNKDDDDDVRKKNTKNVILAGNSIGDAACLLGIRHEHSLSFGFLHEEVEVEEGTHNPLPNGSSSSCSSTNEKVQQFLENYDVIHCGYSSDFSYLLELLQEIQKVNKNNKE
mmetsp:Transcript_49338/g.53242  ORF Transcript_49338/g.53242 Transcript_49338/m.53242 type:complete len:437 (+) Transcript_49338:87-1397(+)